MKCKLKKVLRITVSCIIIGFMVLNQGGSSLSTIHAEDKLSDIVEPERQEVPKEAQKAEEEKQGAIKELPKVTEEKNSEVLVQEDKKEAPLMAPKATEKINIAFYDENDTKVNTVEAPHPITLKVEDENGALLEESKYDIFWYVIISPENELIGKGNTLALTYTSYLNTGGFPIKALITEKGTGDVTELEAKNYAIFNDKPILIINHKPVYMGTTVDGVTLSADGKTITLNNVNIADTKKDFWTDGVLYFLSLEDELTIILQGENTITASETNGLSIGLFNQDKDINVNIIGGGTLNVNVTSDKNTENEAFSIYGSKKIDTSHNINFDGGITLNLSSTTSIINGMSGSALSLADMSLGKISVGNANINATSDSESTISILVPEAQEKEASLYVGPQGKINAKNHFHVEYSIDAPGGAHVSALNFSGDYIDIDGGKIECHIERQTAGEINALFASYAVTTVKNKGELTATNHAKDGYVGKHTEELGGIVIISLIVDNAKVSSDMLVPSNSTVTSGGIFYANELTIINDSNVSVNINGGRFRGIAYGGDTTETADDRGKIFIKDSNVTVDAKTDAPQSDLVNLKLSGIEGRYLTTEMTDDKHAITVNTLSNNMPAIAIFLQKENSTQKIEYNPFYVSDRFVLNGLSGITTPENGNANVYSYIENPEKPVYVVADTIYGEDKTNPAENIKITMDGYTFKEMKDSKHKLSVTGLIDRNAVLSVTNELHKDCSVCEKMNGVVNPIFIGDIALTNAQTPYKGNLGIIFEVDTKYNGKTLTLLHCVDKNIEQIEATVNDGMIQFEVSSLSPFALYDVNEQIIKNNPETGDHTQTLLFVGTLLLSGGIVLISLRLKKRKA